MIIIHIRRFIHMRDIIVSLRYFYKVMDHKSSRKKRRSLMKKFEHSALNFPQFYSALALYCIINASPVKDL